MLICVGLAIGYKSKITSMMLVFSILLPITSLVLLLFTAKLIKTEIRYNALSIEKKETATITVKITNRFFIPIAPANILGYFPLKNSNGIEYQNVFFTVPPFSSVTINFNAPIKFRGAYKCGIEKLYAYDFLKIFRIGRKYNKYEQLIVLPRKFAVNPNIDTNDSDSEAASANSFSLDKNTYAGIREYLPGDPIKQIHWTMSAKQDKIMVKQYERSMGGSCIIIPDFNEYFPFDEDNAEACDCIIEALLAVNMSLAVQKQVCINLWYSSAEKMCRQLASNDQGSFAVLYDMMSRLPRQSEIFLPEDIAQSCTEIPTDCSTVYFITSQIRRDFISKMGTIELFKNKKIRILLTDAPIETSQQAELADAISAARDTELWRIDKNDISSSLNNAIELYKKK